MNECCIEQIYKTLYGSFEFQRYHYKGIVTHEVCQATVPLFRYLQ